MIKYGIKFWLVKIGRINHISYNISKIWYNVVSNGFIKRQMVCSFSTTRCYDHVSYFDWYNNFETSLCFGFPHQYLPHILLYCINTIVSIIPLWYSNINMYLSIKRIYYTTNNHISILFNSVFDQKNCLYIRKNGLIFLMYRYRSSFSKAIFLLKPMNDVLTFHQPWDVN